VQQSVAISLIADLYLARLVPDEAHENTNLSVRPYVCAVRRLRFRCGWRLRWFRNHYVPGKQRCVAVQQLIGHWRKTTIGYTGPIDEHLVLHSDGTVENWTVTAYERREPVTGHWSVDGKTLTLSLGGNDRSSPFTFYQGQLVFPNIPNRRGFWEKIQ
jgi:hypothetical protein